ncbi:sulfite exporter TauE/SafE family protein [Streptomyces sp. 7-21]|uniref:sulfite exporter TauE/SafE family protein n=1 Tax=Streptomyces sp. 7-21 TaxID=2802283 RepID=UPI00191FDEBA|nr:sulfite exporter TauE/SafE family protein [Streptomyces sp. 7-21]MBL1067032.1 sulfite exporter TauE/SafE family protein [Streptomyces sp. 7-21]
MDWWMALSGLFVGVVVGMTGMGGGALMTPILVLFFDVPPLAAVSNDLVASAVMKPVGAGVHLRRGTVNRRLVFWLVLGSVPSAFAGVLIARALGDGAEVQDIIKTALGVALLLAAASMVVKAYLQLRERAQGGRAQDDDALSIRVRPVPTMLVGVAGGIVVGLTSVGSGSLMIIALLLLYPTLKAGSLVGTDLVQAVPLVCSAAIAHILFGDFEFGMTGTLLLGSLPGVYLGARLSSQVSGGLVRRALTLVLLASGLQMLHVPLGVTGVIVGAALALGPLAWMWARKRHGLPALARVETRQQAVSP